MSENRFDSEYRRWVEQLHVDEDDSVWGAVEDELDMAETWSRIESELDRVMPVQRAGLRRTFMAVAAAAAVLLFIVLAINPGRERSGEPAHAGEGVAATEAAATGQPGSDGEHVAGLVTGEQEKATHASEPEEARTGHLADQQVAGPAENGIATTTDQEAIKPVERPATTEPSDQEATKPVERPATTEPSDQEATKPVERSAATEPTDQEATKPVEEESITPAERASPIEGVKRQLPASAPRGETSAGRDASRLAVMAERAVGDYEGTSGSTATSAPLIRIDDIGIVYGYKNTWLLNYETLNGLNPTRLGTTLPTFHHDLGITTTLAVRNRHRIGVEFLLISETGQNYQQYINASYVDRQITLSYVKLQALYLWNHSLIPGSTIIGGYIAGLGMAEEVQGLERFSVRGEYRDYDYGLIFGHQLSIPLVNSVVVSPGLRLNYNLINIFEGSADRPNIFKTTGNLTAGINVAISWRLTK